MDVSNRISSDGHTIQNRSEEIETVKRTNFPGRSITPKESEESEKTFIYSERSLFEKIITPVRGFFSTRSQEHKLKAKKEQVSNTENQKISSVLKHLDVFRPLAEKFKKQESDIALPNLSDLEIEQLQNNIVKEDSELQNPIHQELGHEKEPELQDALNSLMEFNLLSGLSEKLGASLSSIVQKIGLDRLDRHTLLSLRDQYIPIHKRSEFNQFVIENTCVAIGHEWGIRLELQIGRHLVSTTGWNDSLAHTQLAHSINKFFSQEDLSPSAAMLTDEQKEVLKESLNRSIYYSGKSNSDLSQSASQALEDYENHKPVIIGTGWHKHAVEVTLFKDHQGNSYLAYVNRGKRKRGEVLDPSSNASDMKIFKIQGKVTEAVIKQIMGSLAETDEESEKLTRMKWFEGDGLKEALDLTPYQIVSKKDQKIGNCSFASAKGGFHASLIFVLMDHYLKQGDAESIAFDKAQNLAQFIFKDWEFWNRTTELDSFIQLLDKDVIPSPLTPQAFFSLISEMATKITRRNLLKYGTSDYSVQTKIRDNITHMKELIENFTKDCPLSIADCAVPGLSNESAAKILQDQQSGSFLIHQLPVSNGTMPASYAVSYYEGETIKHLTLIPKDDHFILTLPTSVGTEASEIVVKSLKDLHQNIESLKYPVLNEALANKMRVADALAVTREELLSSENANKSISEFTKTTNLYKAMNQLKSLEVGSFIVGTIDPDEDEGSPEGSYLLYYKTGPDQVEGAYLVPAPGGDGYQLEDGPPGIIKTVTDLVKIQPKLTHLVA